MQFTFLPKAAPPTAVILSTAWNLSNLFFYNFSKWEGWALSEFQYVFVVTQDFPINGDNYLLLRSTSLNFKHVTNTPPQNTGSKVYVCAGVGKPPYDHAGLNESQKLSCPGLWYKDIAPNLN